MRNIIARIFLLGVLIASCLGAALASPQTDDSVSHKAKIAGNAGASLRFTLTRASDIPRNGNDAKPTLNVTSAKLARETTVSNSSVVPSYAGSTGVLTAGQVIVSENGGYVCYDTTFATDATSPNIVLALATATQVACPSTTNSYFDGTTLTLSEMYFVSGATTVGCYDVSLKNISSGAQIKFQVTSASTSTCETAHALDTTHLPLGDLWVSLTTPGVGYLWACDAGSSAAGGAASKGPWFNSDGTTWNLSLKEVVSGSVPWTSTFSASFGTSYIDVIGNGLPSHNTGTFPIPSTDAVYAYDRNPNSIKTQAINWNLPANPTYSSTPNCAGGEVGVLLTGARLYSAVDGEDRDAKAWEGQDSCQGHPDSTGYYHYHAVSTCAVTSDVTGEHSKIVGYALDGFPIFGYQGEDGVAVTNANLDECHGHTHAITVNGKVVVEYHYHATQEFPYSVGCFRSKAIMVH